MTSHWEYHYLFQLPTIIYNFEKEKLIHAYETMTNNSKLCAVKVWTLDSFIKTNNDLKIFKTLIQSVLCFILTLNTDVFQLWLSYYNKQDGYTWLRQRNKHSTYHFEWILYKQKRLKTKLKKQCSQNFYDPEWLHSPNRL